MDRRVQAHEMAVWRERGVLYLANASNSVGHCRSTLRYVAATLFHDALTSIQRRVSEHAHLTNRKRGHAQYEIGEWTYGSPSVEGYRCGELLRIRSFCSISTDVKIFVGGEHRWD